MSDDDDSETKPMTPTEIIMEQRRNPDFVPPSQQKAVEEQEARYPLNVPSPLLLASSIFLAIVSTGK